MLLCFLSSSEPDQDNHHRKDQEVKLQEYLDDISSDVWIFSDLITHFLYNSANKTLSTSRKTIVSSSKEQKWTILD